MRLHDIAFYAAGFFLVGVFLFSSGLSFSFIVAAAAFLGVIFLFLGSFARAKRLLWLAGLSLLFVLGAFYTAAFVRLAEKRMYITFGEQITFSGIVVQYPERGRGQRLVVRLAEPYAGEVLAQLRPFPEFSYGDKIRFEGVIRKPEPEQYARHLLKDGISGISTFPRADLVSSGNGSRVRQALFAVKRETLRIFERILPSEEAAFLSGITLGERSGFSTELTAALAASGTTHLVALSGYNISLLVVAIRKSLGRVVARRVAFFLTLALIAGFVVMTGAAASVVRAALMGTVLLLAQEVGRPSSFRNAITLTAFGMVLANPLLARFDIGFQLSFLSLLGITYAAPAVKRALRLKDDPGILAWRENLMATIGAQLAVSPLLILYFGTLPLTAVAANMLVIAFVPWTMTAGFLAAGAGMLSEYLAIPAGWLLHLLLAYELSVIRFFGQFPALSIASLYLPAALFYYAILAFFVAAYARRPARDVLR